MKTIEISYLDDCRLLFRQQDWERYILSLYLPAPQREIVWVLGAFNAEVAKVASAVSQEMTGMIRLKWWLDVLDEIGQNQQVREHPVAQALASVIPGYGIPLGLLQQMVEAREIDIGKGILMADMAALDNYALKTGAALWEPLMALVPLTNQDAVALWLRKAGQLWALQGMLRSTGLHFQQGRSLLPRSVLVAHGLNEETLLGNEPKLEKIPHLVEALAKRWDQSIHELRDAFTALPDSFKPFGLAIRLIKRYQCELVSSPQIALSLNSSKERMLSVQWELLKGGWLGYRF